MRYSAMATQLNKASGPPANESAMNQLAHINTYNAYYIQVSNLAEAMIDIKLFTGPLNIKDVRLLAASPDQNDLIAKWNATLREEPFIKALYAKGGFSLTPVENTAKRANRIR